MGEICRGTPGCMEIKMSLGWGIMPKYAGKVMPGLWMEMGILLRQRYVLWVGGWMCVCMGSAVMSGGSSIAATYSLNHLIFIPLHSPASQV